MRCQMHIQLATVISHAINMEKRTEVTPDLRLQLLKDNSFRQQLRYRCDKHVVAAHRWFPQPLSATLSPSSSIVRDNAQIPGWSWPETMPRYLDGHDHRPSSRYLTPMVTVFASDTTRQGRHDNTSSKEQRSHGLLNSGSARACHKNPVHIKLVTTTRGEKNEFPEICKGVFIQRSFISSMPRLVTTLTPMTWSGIYSNVLMNNIEPDVLFGDQSESDNGVFVITIQSGDWIVMMMMMMTQGISPFITSTNIQGTTCLHLFWVTQLPVKHEEQLLLLTDGR